MEKHYQVGQNLISRTIAGEQVFIPLGEVAGRRADMGIPNETFRFLWAQFREPNTVSGAVQAAHEEYDDPNGTLEQDIRQFVTECVAVGFLEEVSL